MAYAENPPNHPRPGAGYSVVVDGDKQAFIADGLSYVNALALCERLFVAGLIHDYYDPVDNDGGLVFEVVRRKG